MIGDKIIEDFPCMLASPQKFLDRIKFPCIVQEKYDGMRCNIIKKEDKIYVYSRNGKLMNMHGQFDELLETKLPDIALDGELLVYDTDAKLLDRKTGNGILHKAVVDTISKEEAGRIEMIAWDSITLEDWTKGYSDIKYVDRVAWTLISKNPFIQSAPFKVVSAIEEVRWYYEKMIKQGKEGLILKNINHPWEDKRSRNCVKMKEVLDMDLRVVEVIEGEGKYTGMFGKFECENKDGTIKVGVGTGYSDEQRILYWRDRNVLVDKIIAVKYNSVITRKDKDVKSLFLPVFVEIRDDKDTPD